MKLLLSSPLFCLSWGTQHLNNWAHSLGSLCCSCTSKLFGSHFVWEFVLKVELRAEIKHEWPAAESRLGWELCPGKGLWYWHLWHKQRLSSVLSCWGSLCSSSMQWLRLVLDTETTREVERNSQSYILVMLWKVHLDREGWGKVQLGVPLFEGN